MRRSGVRNTVRAAAAVLLASVLAVAASRAEDGSATQKEEFPELAGGYLKADFDKLAGFPFDVPAGAGAKPPADQIPAGIRALDGRKVRVTGFMLPVKLEGGLVKEFLLVANPMLCCYGMVPKINEWVVVRMTGAGVKPLMDIPVEFYGVLRVKETFEEGYLVNIYTLDGERMGAAGG
jgi:hypothetical protein